MVQTVFIHFSIFWEIILDFKILSCKEPPKDYFERIGYDRCGRTDVGVSAFSQTISLKLRSLNTKEKLNPPAPKEEEETKKAEETAPVETKKGKKKKKNPKPQLPQLANPLDYAVKLNGLLPPEIRVYGAAFVPETFSARFFSHSPSHSLMSSFTLIPDTAAASDNINIIF